MYNSGILYYMYTCIYMYMHNAIWFTYWRGSGRDMLWGRIQRLGEISAPQRGGGDAESTRARLLAHSHTGAEVETGTRRPRHLRALVWRQRQERERERGREGGREEKRGRERGEKRERRQKKREH